MDRPSAYRSGPAVGGRGVGASVDDGVTHLKTRGIAVEDQSPDFCFENLDQVAVFAQIVFGSVDRSGECPCNPWAMVSKSSWFEFEMTIVDGPNSSAANCGRARYSLAFVSNNAALTCVPPDPAGISPCAASAASLCWLRERTWFSYADRICGVSSGAAGVVEMRAPKSSVNFTVSGPSGRKIRPGLVQNCPAPSVTELCRPAAISAPRCLSAPGRMNTGFVLPISAYTGIGSGGPPPGP